MRQLAVAIFEGKKKVHLCPECGNYTDGEKCPICADASRRRDIVCVVRDPRDVNAFERMRDYNGLYHVLHGVISPMDGVGPDDIRIRELLSRLAGGRDPGGRAGHEPGCRGRGHGGLHLAPHQAYGHQGDAHRPRRACGRGTGIYGRSGHSPAPSRGAGSCSAPFCQRAGFCMPAKPRVSGRTLWQGMRGAGSGFWPAQPPCVACTAPPKTWRASRPGRKAYV